jgi:hypothetical protein
MRLSDKTRTALLVLLGYALWLVSAAIGAYTSYWIWRALLDLGFKLRLSPWQLRAVDRFGAVILGLVLLIFVVASESYFRRVFRRQRPTMRVARVFVAELLLLGAAYGAHLLII